MFFSRTTGLILTKLCKKNLWGRAFTWQWRRRKGGRNSILFSSHSRRTMYNIPIHFLPSSPDYFSTVRWNGKNFWRKIASSGWLTSTLQQAFFCVGGMICLWLATPIIEMSGGDSFLWRRTWNTFRRSAVSTPMRRNRFAAGREYPPLLQYIFASSHFILSVVSFTSCAFTEHLLRNRWRRVVAVLGRGFSSASLRTYS